MKGFGSFFVATPFIVSRRVATQHLEVEVADNYTRYPFTTLCYPFCHSFLHFVTHFSSTLYNIFAIHFVTHFSILSLISYTLEDNIY